LYSIILWRAKKGASHQNAPPPMFPTPSSAPAHPKKKKGAGTVGAKEGEERSGGPRRRPSLQKFPSDPLFQGIASPAIP
jgi:hypothetical protein